MYPFSTVCSNTEARKASMVSMLISCYCKQMQNIITPNNLTHAKNAMPLEEDQVIYIYQESASVKSCILFRMLSTKPRYSKSVYNCYI